MEGRLWIVKVALGVVIVALLLGLTIPAVYYARLTARRTASEKRLGELGAAIEQFQDVETNLPRGVGDPPRHGWQTQLLPALDQVELHRQIDLELAWDAGENREPLSQTVPAFLNPGIPEPHRGELGYGLTHYVGNSPVFEHEGPLELDEVALSQTLLAGEISAGFPAWGRPRNWRDPADGLDDTNDGFGSPWRDRVYFLMLDGSVRAFDRETNPTVLKRLAAPVKDIATEPPPVEDE